jgi:hypothetical protein
MSDPALGRPWTEITLIDEAWHVVVHWVARHSREQTIELVIPNGQDSQLRFQPPPSSLKITKGA